MSSLSLRRSFCRVCVHFFLNFSQSYREIAATPLFLPGDRCSEPVLIVGNMLPALHFINARDTTFKSKAELAGLIQLSNWDFAGQQQ